MNIKEEIYKVLHEQRGFQTEEVLAQGLSELVTEWALECVGEDEEMSVKEIALSYSSTHAKLGINAANKAIRQRIEESTK